MSSGSTEKESRYAFSFPLKSPCKRTSPCSPTGPLWRELPVYKAFFNISLKFLVKIPLNTEIYHFSSQALEKERPSMFTKSGALMVTDVNFQSLT